jgi:hypothetical protein
MCYVPILMLGVSIKQSQTLARDKWVVLMHSGYYVHHLKKIILSTECVHEIRINLRINLDNFFKQKLLAFLCNSETIVSCEVGTHIL